MRTSPEYDAAWRPNAMRLPAVSAGLPNTKHKAPLPYALFFIADWYQ
jgi:hypothetical protein